MVFKQKALGPGYCKENTRRSLGEDKEKTGKIILEVYPLRVIARSS